MMMMIKGTTGSFQEHNGVSSSMEKLYHALKETIWELIQNCGKEFDLMFRISRRRFQKLLKDVGNSGAKFYLEN
jgi:hypothetical protein